MWQRVDAWAARDCGVTYSIFCQLIPLMKWTDHDYTVIGDQAMSQVEKGCENEYLDTAQVLSRSMNACWAFTVFCSVHMTHGGREKGCFKEKRTQGCISSPEVTAEKDTRMQFSEITMYRPSAILMIIGICSRSIERVHGS